MQVLYLFFKNIIKNFNITNIRYIFAPNKPKQSALFVHFEIIEYSHK